MYHTWKTFSLSTGIDKSIASLYRKLFSNQCILFSASLRIYMNFLAAFSRISSYICLYMPQTYTSGSVFESIIPSYSASNREMNWAIENFSFLAQDLQHFLWEVFLLTCTWTWAQVSGIAKQLLNYFL